MKIVLTCYDGFDGMTIRIDTDSDETIETVQRVFQQLCDAEVNHLEFISLEDVKAEGLRSLLLERIDRCRNQ